MTTGDRVLCALCLIFLVLVFVLTISAHDSGERRADERWQKETLMRGYAEYRPDKNGVPTWQWKEVKP
jgi:hypothetical protein